MARYVTFDRFGPPEVLRLISAPAPEAGPGQVRVRVHTAGLNPVDLKILAGGAAAASYRVDLPSGNGNDFAGVIDHVGAGVTGFDAGDAVFGGMRMYAQADYLVIDASRVLPMPQKLAFVEAGALDIAGRAAWASVHSLHLGAGDTVLVSAAAGGVGVLAAQLALRTGATVIGTASAANHDFLAGLGVVPVAYGVGLVDRLRQVAPHYTAALDNDGPATVDAALALGVPGRRINTIAARGYRTEEGVRSVGGQYAEPTALAALAELIANGEVRLPIDSVYPVERARDAYEHLASRHVRGKVALALE